MQSWFPTFGKLSAAVRALWPWYTTVGQRQALLRLIAVALEEKLPLAPLIANWALDERGLQRHRLHRLAGLLQSGMPLPDAVEGVAGVLSDEDLLAIRFDAQLGTRTKAVRQTVDEAQAVSRSQIPQVRKAVAYFFLIVILALPFITFIHIKIIPVVHKMFSEFGLRVPQLLVQVDHFAHWFAAFWWLAALGIIALLWCLFNTRSGRHLRQSVFSRWLQPLRELRAADVLQTLGIASTAGRPIPGALSTLARYHFDPTIRHQLLFVRNEMEQGADVWHSLTTVGLLTPPEMRLLKSAERVGNQPWALQQLVSGKRRRSRRRLEQLSALVLPALVGLIGVVVLIYGLVVFLPLTGLIESLL